VADDGRNQFLLAIDDYHAKTNIRFKQYDPRTDSDYVQITGENSGCWSYIGRIGKVSSRVEGVVKTSPELRIAPLGLSRFTSKTKIQTDLSQVTTTPYNLRAVCPKCYESIPNQLWVTPTTNRVMLTADFEMYFNIYLFVYTKLCLL
jgi:hypothetical protein